MSAVGVLGVGQTPYVTRRADVTFPELVREGALLALDDAGITMDDVDAVVFPLAPDALIGVGNGERWCVEALGAAGKPFMRVNNGGATGMSAVIAAWTHVASGMFDVVLVAGGERVSESGSAQSVLNKMWDVGYERPIPLNTITMLALSAVRYMHAHGADEADFARVTVKNRRHAALNPLAHLREPVTVEDVLASRVLAWPIKLGDACPSSTGAAGAVLVSERYARAHGLRPAWIRGIGQNTETFWMGDRVGPRMLADHGDADALAVAFERAYAMAGVTDPAGQLDVAEIYAPFSSVELHVIEAAGLCGKGEAPARLAQGDFALGAKGTIVNPSGGVLCSNPIAVTGVARLAEATLQVQGRAGDRQVEGARTAVASAIGGDHQFYASLVLSADLEDIA
ncbi:thiolase family protein [Pseudonocardia benzenivorans]|jgi:acetyl-CoA C-acetyltransferase|uniref:Propanoyl-CoA C-acyltransferase n=2 Tax=Pseudonocardia TaxID=1847 RepID=F4CJP7_PSEUX|nr:thiolase family protein [Pseudonocardia dioxanivorans]AEA25907.1 Propanoyl-CoA C-acyltransferase [Pseudonocardia dioxanivorans CB1190]GJF06334.1 3-ketoacyl-CoA thiolase [Pseudonocardia sp. D17]